MTRLALVALMIFSACEKTSSKLEGTAKGDSAGEPADTSELEVVLSSMESRIKALEATHDKSAFDANASGDASLAGRLAKIEANLTRREEALGFLEMAFAQQKRQQEQQEAQEPDDNAVFAVDVSKAIAAGQVDGPNSAMVTIIEAWDFA